MPPVNLHKELELIPTLTAGVITGILQIIAAISLAALIFSGNLADYTSQGIGIALLSAVIISTVIALMSSYAGISGGVQDGPAAILALVATVIVANRPASKETFVTVVAAIALTSVLTGVFFLTLGTFRLGGLIRFIPYPVIGGFLAGAGLLITTGSFAVSAGVTPSFSTLNELFDGDMVIRWVPGIGFAAALLFATQYFKHPLTWPAMMVVGVLLFYIVLALTGTSVDTATDDGWFLGPFPEGGLWQPLSPNDLFKVDWEVIGGNVSAIATILIVSGIGLLLNASGLELTVESDIDLNQELRSAGTANLLSGMTGGMVGFQALSYSTLTHQLGSKSRFVGIIAAIMCGIVLLLGASVLSYLPKPILAGLLFLQGALLMIEWVYHSWFKLSRTDYAVIILIVIIMALIGYLEGVLVGIIAAGILFIIEYSRINIVKHEMTGKTYHSTVTRSALHESILKERGERIFILELNGFIFFGTANSLLERVRRRVNNSELPSVRFVILDFRQVKKLDSSAVLSFVKLEQLAKADHFTLILTALNDQIRNQLEKGEVSLEKSVKTFVDLDRGTEWCEDQILMGEQIALNFRRVPLETQLREMFPKLEKPDDIITYMERYEAPAGYYLVKQGEHTRALYFIESGMVSVQLELPSGQTMRIRTASSGTVLGELGLYLGTPRTASIVTDQPTTFYTMTAAGLERMKAEKPAIAAAFHEYIAHLLAEKLVDSTATLQALLQ